MKGLRAYLRICHLWQRQTNNIIDVIGTDTDTKLYLTHSLETVLDIQEKEKKKKNLLLCLDQHI